MLLIVFLNDFMHILIAVRYPNYACFDVFCTFSQYF
jgi:hypothetical protein